MKTTCAWIVAAGVAVGVATVPGMPASAAMDTPAPLGPDKADLTPKYKAGDKFTFKQKTVRKDVMTLGNMGGDAKGEGSKDAPKTDAPKGEAPKTAPPAGEKPKGDAPKTDAPKGDAPKSEPKKDEKPPAAPGITQTASGMSSTQSIDQTAVYELRVVEASETGVVFELELMSVVATAEMAQGKFTWDSSTPPALADKDNEILKAYRPIVGAVARIKLGADGNIATVEPDLRVNVNTRTSLAPNVQALVGADGLRLRWAPVLWFKDGKEPAAVGQSWPNTESTVFPAVGKFTYETTSTLQSVKDGVAEIAYKGEIKLGPVAEDKPASGTLSEQHITGSCLWDTAKGLCKSHVWEQKQVLDLNAQGIPVKRASEFTVTTTRE